MPVCGMHPSRNGAASVITPPYFASRVTQYLASCCLRQYNGCAETDEKHFPLGHGSLRRDASMAETGGGNTDPYSLQTSSTAALYHCSDKLFCQTARRKSSRNTKKERTTHTIRRKSLSADIFFNIHLGFFFHSIKVYFLG